MTSDTSPRANFIASIPFEIWHYISRFILDSQLRQLYTVNRAFFDIAMALRYRTVAICGENQSLKDFDLVPNYKILETPSLAEYVRHLVFLVDCCGSLQEYRQPRSKTLELLLHLPHALQELEVFVKSLRYLTKVTIIWSSCSSHKLHCDAYLDVLVQGWRTFGSNIRTLSLTTTINSIPSLLATPLHLSHLEELNLEMRKDDTSTESALQETLIPFIHRHASTLQALKISPFPQDDHLKFYTSLGHFPSLRKFTFMGQFGDRNLPDRTRALSRFLSLHSNTLAEFNWDLGAAYASPPLDVSFPKLSAFKIVYSVFGRNNFFEFQDITRYLHKHVQPLESISVLNANLYPPEIQNLLGTRAASKLRSLELSPKVFEYVTFTAVAEALPNLEHFVIVFDRFDLRSTDFSDGNLKEWGLFELVLKIQNSRIKFVEMWGKLILESIPRVEYLNGMYREDFLKPIHCLRTNNI